MLTQRYEPHLQHAVTDQTIQQSPRRARISAELVTIRTNCKRYFLYLENLITKDKPSWYIYALSVDYVTEYFISESVYRLSNAMAKKY